MLERGGCGLMWWGPHEVFLVWAICLRMLLKMDRTGIRIVIVVT
jgi:hypothetical protein